MAGERLWSTGQPATPRRVLGTSTARWLRAPRRRFAAARAPRLLILLHVGQELLVVRLEHVRAVAARLDHEVQELARGWMRGGLDRRQPGVVDRRGRQPLVDPRVVGRA